MLAQTVINYPTIGLNGSWPHDQAQVKIPTSCHFATCFWLFLDEFGREPSQDDLGTIGNAQLVVSGLIPRGTRLHNPIRGSLRMTPEAILVFAENNKIARHSCVAIDAQTLSGYNQLGWYSAGGENHGHSTHTTNQLMWGVKDRLNEARNFGATAWYQLYEIPEALAKGTIKGLMQ
jgi:hypothetical protein